MDIDTGPTPGSPRTREQQRIEELEYQLARQEHQIAHVEYLAKRLSAALLATEADKARMTMQADYIDKLHRLTANLGVRGDIIFREAGPLGGPLELRMLLADEVILTARPGLRDILGYTFAQMTEEIERTIRARLGEASA